MIPIKTKKEIEIMRKGGKIAAQVKKELVRAARPGVTTAKLDKLAEKLIKKSGALPSFKGYNNYPCTIVTCINKEAVHGIPSSRRLKKGDLLTIDLGVYYCGFHNDTAVTVTVGQLKKEVKPTNRQTDKLQSFLQTGQQALENAIKQCKAGNYIGDISHAIQQTVEAAGYNIIRAFVGHGVGRQLHEPPQIPCFGKKGEGEEIKLGMTFAIEVMYSKGLIELEILSDNWTAVTRDKSLSAMFEETVAITKNGALVLTRT